MDNTRQIKEYIAACEHMLKFFRKLLTEENIHLSGPANENERLAELTELRMLAKTDIWPQAVTKELISEDNLEGQMVRASGILTEYIVENLTGKRFLDFGCGSGEIAEAAQSLFRAKAFGYDIRERSDWANLKECKLTSNINTIKQAGPFDVILLYDVLDHAHDPVEILKLCKQLKSVDSKIYVRCHPWSSRTGLNVHKTLNKAYLQLVFSETELTSLGIVGEKTTKIKSTDIYKKWIDAAELTIIRESSIKQEIELFFTHNPAVLRRIKSNFDEVFPRDLMEIQFVDFVLI